MATRLYPCACTGKVGQTRFWKLLQAILGGRSYTISRFWSLYPSLAHLRERELQFEDVAEKILG